LARSGRVQLAHGERKEEGATLWVPCVRGRGSGAQASAIQRERERERSVRGGGEELGRALGRGERRRRAVGLGLLGWAARATGASLFSFFFSFLCSFVFQSFSKMDFKSFF